MNMHKTIVRPVAILLAAGFGVAIGACGPHSEYRIENVCEDYCERLYDCTDTTDIEDCIDECIDQADRCDTDSDIEEALDILDECIAESCNEIIGCSIEAWGECII
ncbi:hypothetical protein G6O69_30315 [Pseudenhygromyxa sp. WMMC2535]|uniref:hypothetical protein n=1 Tax=Pseudenhygromyxa sp. WMMC2535 TaxID=2712867 RepID=UPI001556F347|nr:hypothetical protein [Pseudenhygromyxa sp. WMMC2535]NVB42156.1 hypothetical protein [Pseudenhygromyxa sp. WMMC2535]